MEERYTQVADLQTCLVDTPAKARLRVVFLHGHDMKASDLTPFAHSLGIPGVAYAFPQAPTAVSATGYAWWPRVTAGADVRPGVPRDLWQDYPAGREPARALIRNLLAALRSECDEPLALAGFSQGGMLACDTVLMEDVDVTALAMLSASCIASSDWLERRARLEGAATFVSHGRSDPDLAFDAGLRLARFLDASGAAVTWMPFDGGHEIPFTVWRRFKQFVQGTLRDSNEDMASAYEAD
ncbi:MAG: hypothetical protein WDO56_20740 [Gammaproteobacteria bacterium]